MADLVVALAWFDVLVRAGLLTNADVRAELVRVRCSGVCCQRAEVSALVRVSGVLLPGDRLVVPCASFAVAARLRTLLVGALDADAWLVRGKRDFPWVVIARRASLLSVQLGLVNRAGQPVQGLASHLVLASDCDVPAVLRGVFLARGFVVVSMRSVLLGFEGLPGQTPLALQWLARRAGVVLRSRGGSVFRIEARDPSDGERLLALMGACSAAARWEGQRAAVAAAPRSVSGLGQANRERSAAAAAAAAAAVEQALGVLGEGVPEHLRQAGELRLAHPEASLDQLGQLADPPMSKDAIAGRLRRLLAAGRAAESGV